MSYEDDYGLSLGTRLQRALDHLHGDAEYIALAIEALDHAGLSVEQQRRVVRALAYETDLVPAHQLRALRLDEAFARPLTSARIAETLGTSDLEEEDDG